jgi:[acyl-carrier-protein] S-malonyltransferase|tara:strand:+ start:57 stop:968 length:912 start_codon:yes stop_codon:yes gene_type:complete
MSNKNISILFTGQGSQHANMGIELIESLDWVKQRYSQSSDILGYDVIKTQQDPEKINLTEFSQPLIFIYSSVLIDIFKNSFKKTLSNKSLNLAGHSLGEYLALYYSNVLDFEDMLNLVSIRGKSMAKVSDPSKYGMYAILTKQKIDKNIFDQNVYLANINSPNQVVICGIKKYLEDFKVKNNIGRYIPLNVSAPFHSALMKDSSNLFLDAAKKFNFHSSSFDLLSNHNLTNYKDIKKEDYSFQLANQIFSTVQWSETVENFIVKDIKEFYEIGPKKTLLNFLPKSDNIKTYPFCSFEDINNYV